MNELSVVDEQKATPIVRGAGANAVLLPNTLDEAYRFATAMSQADLMVGGICRGNKGNALAVVMQSMRWRMDPFAVSHECYNVKGNLAYGAKLVNAVIQANAPIKGRLNYEYFGEIENKTRQVRVFATFLGETEPREVMTPKLKDIAIQNSPLWKNDPDQQLAYYGSRTWARRHAPDIIMGVACREDLEHSPEMKDVTPASSRLKARLSKAVEVSEDATGTPETGPDVAVESQKPTQKPDIDRPAILTMLDMFIGAPNDRALMDVWVTFLADTEEPETVLEAWKACQTHEAIKAIPQDFRATLRSKTNRRVDELQDIDLGQPEQTKTGD